MILKLKNGSGIHIKKKNRGKFTEYCGGKVTSACISKGKHSSDPKIRKRSTFAANARKWKHEKGGKAFVSGVSILDSNKDAYKYVKKKYKMRSALLGTKLELGENLTDEQFKNIEGVWNYLTQTKGVSPRNAAAIMGNVWQESRFLPLRVSSAGATGWMLFLGLRDKDYLKWLKTNEHHPDYGLFDYILYAILDSEHKHDFYRNDYERIVNNMKKFKKQGNNKAYNEYNTYKNKIYGTREKEGRLHFFNDVNTAFNDPKYKLDDLTTLWHDSIERSNPAEANIPTRIKAANAFYNYYNPKPDPLNLPNLYSGSILYHMKFGGRLISKAEEGTKLNFWLKTGNFINSDLGKGLLNMVTGGLSTINNSVKATNYANEFDEATDAQIKAMLEQAYNEKYKEGLLLAPMILLSDGNVNYSNIDYLLFAKLYAEGNTDLSAIAKFKMDRLKEKLELIDAILGSSSGFGDILKLGLGMVGDYLNKKSTSKSEIPNYYKLFFGKTELPKVDLMLTYKDMLKPKYNTINLDNNSSMNKLKIDLYSRMI